MKELLIDAILMLFQREGTESGFEGHMEITYDPYT
jgi:hypothetical protein